MILGKTMARVLMPDVQNYFRLRLQPTLLVSDHFLQKTKPLYVYCEKSDQTSMAEVAKDFMGDNYSKLRGRSNLHYCNGIIKS